MLASARISICNVLMVDHGGPVELLGADDPAFDELREAYESGNLVIFVGSGVSMAAGLPSRAELLARLEERARARGATEAARAEIANLARKEQLLEALAAAKSVLSPVEFCSVIEHSLDDRNLKVPELIQAIAALAPRLRAVLTTNLDHLLERAFAGTWPAVAHATADIGQRRGFILKLRGTLLERSTWVFTREDADRAAYADPELKGAFQTLFHACPVLFLGYEPSDGEFEEVLVRVRAIAGEQPPRHFALIAADRVKPFYRKQLEGAGVRVIPYPNPDGKHTDVLHMLKKLAGDSRTPNYPDDHTRVLSEKLENARKRRKKLLDAGARTSDVDCEILDLRRQLREGGQLKAGDSLGEGRYLLVDRIGKGGFGTVWRAFDRETNEEVAVKVLHPELAGDTVRLERFFRGARVMAELHHEGVVRVRELHGEDGGYHYFVMDLMSGGDFQKAVTQKRLSRTEVIPVLLRIGAALAAAHAKGLIHRDIKPANILLDREGTPWLTDFDLVGGEHTTGGTKTGAMGTFLYAAPELLSRPQEADARADVYGLGMTAVFGLYGADLPAEVVGGNAEKLIDGLPCSDAVKVVLKRAVRWSDKDARHANAGEFCKELREASSPKTEAPAHPRNTPPRITAVQVGGAGLALVVAFIVVRFYFGWDPAKITRLVPWSDPVELKRVPRYISADWLRAVLSSPPSNLSCPEGMVLIPGGEFKMGSPEGEGEPDERPQHDVYISTFCIDQTEVTVAQYRKCVGCRPPGKPRSSKRNTNCNWSRMDRERHPINCVDHALAEMYCSWKRARLPTEAEWEYVARGGDEQRVYPWGNDEPAAGQSCWRLGEGILLFAPEHPDVRMAQARLDAGTVAATCEVKTYSKDDSRWNVYDLARNVREWTGDFYGPYSATSSLAKNPTGPEIAVEADIFVVRGRGSVDPIDYSPRTARRMRAGLSFAAIDLGFRCVRKPVEAPE